jgi:hypothetical protein
MTQMMLAKPTMETNSQLNPDANQDTKRQQKIEKRREDMPRKFRKLYDRATAGNSLRAAINAQCLECIHWQVDEIRRCTCLACPLYAVRPYQNKPAKCS